MENGGTRNYSFVFTFVIRTKRERLQRHKMDIENKLEDIFKRFWQWRLVNAPEFGTSIGIHLYSNRLDEMNLNSYKRRQNEAQFFLDELINLKGKDSLSETNQLNYELLKSDLEQYINGMDFQTYLFPLNMLEGPQLDFPRMLSWMETKTLKNFQDIIDRLRLFPQRIDETIRLLNEGIRKGITMHHVSVSVLPSTLSNMSSLSPEDTPHYKPFKEKPEDISNTEWEKIIDTAKAVIQNDVLSAYKRLSIYFQDVYIANTRSSIAATSLPNGEAFYDACLKFHTTTSLTPQNIHDIGIKEVNRITTRMEEVKNSVQYEGNLEEFRKHLRTDSKFKFKSKEDILQHYREVCENIESILPQYFDRLPKAKCQIVPVPEEVAPSFPGAYYLAPPADGSRPGTFYINTHNPTNRAKYEAVSLALHEAQPGHHLQGSLTMESGSLVPFRRFFEDRNYYEPPGRFAMCSAYIEGWGLYSEYLGEEMNLYTDPYDLFGRLSHEMLRACRLVVDTGMHALNWSKQQAIDYMMVHTATSEEDVTSEIDRYITWPGQACGYKIGEIKIKELRGNVENILGEKFNLKRFHDFVASMGAVPLDILEKQMENFIQDEK